MKKILTLIFCALFALLPLSACKKEDDGLKKVRVNEVTHSVFYAPMYIADALGYFEEEGIQIELTNGGGADAVMAAVLSGSADIGFCGTDTHNPDCVFESFIQDHLVIITPNTERFRQMRTTGIKADFLKTEPIILREEGSGTRKETEHFLAKAGIDIGELKIAAQFNDPDSIKHAVSQGMGISIISKAAVEDYENFGLLLSFDLSGISMDRHLYIVSHKNNPLSFIGEVFLNFVKMYYDK